MSGVAAPIRKASSCRLLTVPPDVTSSGLETRGTRLPQNFGKITDAQIRTTKTLRTSTRTSSACSTPSPHSDAKGLPATGVRPRDSRDLGKGLEAQAMTDRPKHGSLGVRELQSPINWLFRMRFSAARYSFR